MPLSQPQAGASHPQAGSQQSATPQAGASHPQAGSPQIPVSHPQAGSQQEGASQHAVSQPEPPHLIPSIRSSKSNPKLWLQILQPTTRAIVIIVRFIGATSPFLNLAV
jgi:hypothetical protein